MDLALLVELTYGQDPVFASVPTLLERRNRVNANQHVDLDSRVPDGVYEPLGSIKAVKADVRVITATNKDLRQLVREGRFRDDLFYRLHVVRLELPRLPRQPRLSPGPGIDEAISGSCFP